MRPNVGAMIQARVQIDDELNQAVALLAPTDEGELPEFDETAMRLVRSRLARARRLVDELEDACRGA